MVGGEQESWVKGRAGERRQRVRAPVKGCSWPMQFPTALIWHPHKGKAGVFLTALRVRRRPVEDRASTKKRGGSASGIPLPGSKNFLAVNINGASAPFILPGLNGNFPHPCPLKSTRTALCTWRCSGGFGESTPASGGALIMLRLKTPSLCSERQRAIAGGWELPLFLLEGEYLLCEILPNQ